MIDPAERSVGDLIGRASRHLPRHEAEILLGHLLGVTRTALLIDPRVRPTDDVASVFMRWVERRLEGEPLQYLTGTQAFGGLNLAVGPGVLIPRPETEQLVQVALDRLSGIPEPAVVDVGTGSGAIAISIATERPDASVWGTELSGEALEWATKNAESSGVSGLRLVRCDLFEGLPTEMAGGFDLVVSNPPYLSHAQLPDLPADVRAEPEVATIGGPSGMEVTSRLIREAPRWLRGQGGILIESWPGQVDEVMDELSRSFVDVRVHADLAGSDRIVEGTLA